MRTLSVALLGFAVTAGLSAQNQNPPHTHLKVGDMAPDFTLPATTGGTVHLSDYPWESGGSISLLPRGLYRWLNEGIA